MPQHHMLLPLSWPLLPECCEPLSPWERRASSEQHLAAKQCPDHAVPCSRSLRQCTEPSDQEEWSAHRYASFSALQYPWSTCCLGVLCGPACEHEAQCCCCKNAEVMFVPSGYASAVRVEMVCRPRASGFILVSSRS